MEAQREFACCSVADEDRALRKTESCGTWLGRPRDNHTSGAFTGFRTEARAYSARKHMAWLLLHETLMAVVRGNLSRGY
jgi:hypothetical protein